MKKIVGSKEFLIIGNSHILYHIDSDDIGYIRALGNYSNIYLINGEVVRVLMKIKDVEAAIGACLPYYQKDFQKIGRSLIINERNLSKIDCSPNLLPKLEFSGKRTEDYLKGYEVGYDAGYKAGVVGKDSSIPPDTMILKDNPNQIQESSLPQAPIRDYLKKMKNRIGYNEEQMEQN